MASNQKVIYVYESFRSITPNFLGTLFVENVRGRESYISWWLYEGEPDYKVWSSDNTEEWNLTEPEALYDFIVNECQE